MESSCKPAILRLALFALTVVVLQGCGEAPPRRVEAPGSDLVIPPLGSARPAPEAAHPDVAPDDSDSFSDGMLDPLHAENAARPACAFDPSAASVALRAVEIRSCLRRGATTVSGHVRITFERTGLVQAADVEDGPFAGTEIGTCIAEHYRRIRVAPFCGAAATVIKSLRL